MILKHNITIKDGRAFVDILGLLDQQNVMHLETVINKTVNDFSVNTVRVDLLKAEFLPSICFGAMIEIAEKLKTRKVRVEVALSHHNADLARSIGLTRVAGIRHGECFY